MTEQIMAKSNRAEEIYRIALIAALSLILLFVRRPDAFFHPDFWAEDGVIFWRGWIDHGLGSLIQPYAGYQIFSSRIIAAVASLFPMRDAVNLYLAGAVFFTIWTSVTIALLIPGAAGVLAALAPLLAHGAFETLATPTNIQWPMACAMAVIAISPLRASRLVQFNNAAFLVFAAFTGPFSIFALPIFAVRSVIAWRARASFDFALTGVVLLGALVQLYFLAKGAPASSGPSAPRPIQMAYHLTLLSVGGTIGLVAFILAAGSVFVGDYKFQRAGLGLVAAAVIAATLAKLAHHAGTFATGSVGFRYWYVPSTLILIAMALMLREQDRRLRWAGMIGILTILYGYVHRPFISPARQHFGSWSEAVDSGAATYKFPPGWTVKIPKGPQ